LSASSSEPIDLNFRVSGQPADDQGAPLIILHGLFGTLDNWGGQVKTLAEHFQVFALDLRNHGRSPQSPAMDYSLMVQDLIAFMDRQQLDRIALMGHSMGGKVAMQMALDHPERITQLAIVDIAPVAYPPGHDDVFAGLNAIVLNQLASRREADQQLSKHIQDATVRQFLLKNLYRDEGKFRWRMNLEALQKNYPKLAQAPRSETPYTGPTLFIKGGESDYIRDAHREVTLRLFPHAQAKVIAGAGHWPHAEKPPQFTRIVQRFFE
jgi:esterase